ncbi:rho GTPase-activating protein 45-like isoform X1 [Scyliorhinus torazame]|uniref:rho GTPase-activating protein 45-like isoform X1 n=1 Tax=Scyliorhinus torazame TaxID=75743 RepID=UPI003B5A0E84
MLSKRSAGKSSYSPYTIGLRGKKGRSKSGLDLLPNRPKELPRKDAIEVPASQTGTLSELSAVGSLTKLSSSPSAVSTLKRPNTLSRHSSAAGFPVASSGTWGYSKGYRASPVYSTTSSESYEGPEVEEITQLLLDVARFAETVEKLKDIVLEEKTEMRRPVAHECLGEVLRILRQVIYKYPLLNTIETLTAAGTLISKVKGFHYESNNEDDKMEFEKAIETMAVAFSSNVSEFLMGEVDSSTLLSLPPTDKCRSMENLCGGIAVQGDMVQVKDEFSESEEVDIILQRSEGGVEAALHYAKTVSKYMKDLINYLEKRTALEMDFAKGLIKLIHTCKPSITQEYHVPFLSIYALALEQDLDSGHNMIQGVNTLQNKTFLQPLAGRRLDHEKRRKEIKELWHRAQRKLQEAEANLKKAKQAYMQRSEEHEKAKNLAVKAEEEQQGTSSSNTSKTLDKKRRTEEDARNKADEAEATYRTCIADAKTQKQELEDVKVNVLRQIQEIIKQSDQTLKSATISYYQSMHMQTAPLPVHFQTLCESSKLYDPGQQYASYVKDLQVQAETDAHYDFESYSSQIGSPHGRARKNSFNSNDFASNTANEVQSQSSVDEPGSPDVGSTQKEARGGAATERRGARTHQVHKSWPSTMGDTDSVGGGGSGLESPSSITGDFSKKLPRIPSSGAISSSEDVEDKDGNAKFEQSINGIAPEMAVSTGPFKNVGLSKAAQTHRLRKLRTPSKCRECDSYVYFQGAECEECNLACHKKCLETLAIKCGHKKLQRKLQLFGRDFAQAARDSYDGIPFIIKTCISEIEKRALSMKGMYRVNGVKTRVEKLCQAFENGKELVELSQASPHDISNVLKLYLRQLPEPIMLFRLYHDLMGLAKESLQGSGVTGNKDSMVEKDLLLLVTRLKDLLKDLPSANKATLQYIIRHLSRISELEQYNKMSPSNLGIVFGPTLMRPRPTEATVSLSSLVDYPHQARIVETLIIFYTDIFEPKAEFNMPSDEDTVDETLPTDERGSSAARMGSGSDLPDLDETAEFERGRLYSDALCENSLGSERSSGSRERSLDSDFELEDGTLECGPGQTGCEEGVQRNRKGCLPKQESVISADEPPFYNDPAEDECTNVSKQTDKNPAQGSDASQTEGSVPETSAEGSQASPQQLKKDGQEDAGDEELGHAGNSNRSLADFNTNQSNNVDRNDELPVHCTRPRHTREQRSQLPWVRMRHGKIDIGLENRDPEFV